MYQANSSSCDSELQDCARSEKPTPAQQRISRHPSPHVLWRLALPHGVHSRFEAWISKLGITLADVALRPLETPASKILAMMPGELSATVLLLQMGSYRPSKQELLHSHRIAVVQQSHG